MSALRRVVFDTSTLIGAALQPGSVPHRALSVALGMGDVCASESTLAELEQVLARPKFDRFQVLAMRVEFAAMFRRNAHLFAVGSAEEAAVVPACRDVKDNKFLALAKASGAHVLVSSDADLRVLNPWNGVQILSPADFLAAVRPAA